MRKPLLSPQAGALHRELDLRKPTAPPESICLCYPYSFGFRAWHGASDGWAKTVSGDHTLAARAAGKQQAFSVSIVGGKVCKPPKLRRKEIPQQRKEVQSSKSKCLLHPIRIQFPIYPQLSSCFPKFIHPSLLGHMLLAYRHIRPGLLLAERFSLKQLVFM